MAGRAVHLFKVCALILIGLAYLSTAPGAESRSVAVLYPDIGGEYNSVFSSIADGITETIGTPLHRIPLSNDYSSADLANRLRNLSTKGVVALGRRGLEASRAVEWNGPLVLGAVIRDSSIADKKLSGISLDPDPRPVFGYLKLLAPRVRRIHLVLNQERSGWIVERARLAASDMGLSLVLKEVTSRREAALAYRDVLASIDGSQDALWLPIDPDTVDETTLQLVLRAAWNDRFIAFSSTADHAQRGVLFSVIPDYVAVGRQLGSLLQAQMRGEAAAGVRPNGELRLAVNMRTARHLGLEFSRSTEAKIAVVYQ